MGKVEDLFDGRVLASHGNLNVTESRFAEGG